METMRVGCEGNAKAGALVSRSYTDEDRKAKARSLRCRNGSLMCLDGLRTSKQRLTRIMCLANDRRSIILPKICERAGSLLYRLTARERKDYESVKSAVLEALRLSVGEYHRLLITSHRANNYTSIQFATRLENYLIYYSNCQNVTTFEQRK